MAHEISTDSVIGFKMILVLKMILELKLVLEMAETGVGTEVIVLDLWTWDNKTKSSNESRMD